jgi:tripartite-type tricarboxylate transporter receptor subunit TctC
MGEAATKAALQQKTASPQPGEERDMRRIIPLLAASVALTFTAHAAGAQTFPSRTVKIGVPFPAGGGTDLLARLIGEALAKKWGQSVVVENLSGAASGNVGSNEVARSTPDGYTLLLSPPGPIAMNRLLYKSMPFDSSKWVPISVVASVPYVLAVRNGLGVADVKELVARAKANPGKITYASPGVGTVGHLAAKQLEMLAGISMTTVPYKGLAPALNDIMGGHVDLIFDTGTTSLPMHNNKQLTIIATGSAERWPGLPNVPTMAESGLPGFRAVTWYGIVAPEDTPSAVAEKISRDVVAVVKDPEVAKSINEKLRMDPIGMSNREAAQLFESDAKLWAKVIQEAKISLD